ARELTGSDFAALGVGNDPDRPFDPWVFSGMTAAQADAIGRIPRPRGLLGTMPQGVESFRTRDVTAAPESLVLPPNHPPIGPFLRTTIMGTGTVGGGRRVGHLYLARRTGREPFDVQDERIVRLLAAHAAVAIESAQLYREAQAAVRARENLIAVISHD